MATSRRSLAGGAVAALLGTVITTDDSAAAFSDARLIALCREYVEHSARHHALCGKQEAMPKQQSAAEHAEWTRLELVPFALAHGKALAFVLASTTPDRTILSDRKVL